MRTHETYEWEASAYHLDDGPDDEPVRFRGVFEVEITTHKPTYSTSYIDSLADAKAMEMADRQGLNPDSVEVHEVALIDGD